MRALRGDTADAVKLYRSRAERVTPTSGLRVRGVLGRPRPVGPGIGKVHTPAAAADSEDSVALRWRTCLDGETGKLPCRRSVPRVWRSPSELLRNTEGACCIGEFDVSPPAILPDVTDAVSSGVLVNAGPEELFLLLIVLEDEG